nr:MAG TPA: hypothetical protein [Caudoviricetes sp.]
MYGLSKLSMILAPGQIDTWVSIRYNDLIGS